MNELVKGGTWQPERIRWDHPRIENYIEDNWKERGDKELAEDLSEMTGKNVTPSKVKDKRLDMGIDRHEISRKNLNHDKFGPDSVIDWRRPEVIKYIQTRYRDKSDIEIAEGLSEKYDEEVTWSMVKKRRLEMGYTKDDPKPKTSELDLGEHRRYIFENHPQLAGDEFDTISDFLVHFYKKFDVDVTIRSLKRRMRKFIKNDPYVNLMQEIIIDYKVLRKIKFWLP